MHRYLLGSLLAGSKTAAAAAVLAAAELAVVVAERQAMEMAFCQ